MSRQRLLRGIWPAGFAVAGVIGAHSLTYLAAVPEHVRRWQLLRTTGHAHFGGFVALAAVLGGLSLFVLVLRAARSGAAGGAPQPFAPVWRFVALQLALFAALEAGERLATGTSLRMVLADRVLMLGVVVQVLVALATAIALRWLARAVTLVARSLAGRRPVAGRVASPAAASVRHLAVRLDAGAIGVRGPPVAFR